MAFRKDLVFHKIHWFPAAMKLNISLTHESICIAMCNGNPFDCTNIEYECININYLIMYI